MRADIVGGVTIMQRFCTVLCLNATSQFRNGAGEWLNSHNRLAYKHPWQTRPSYPLYPGHPCGSAARIILLPAPHWARPIDQGLASGKIGKYQGRFWADQREPQLAPGAGSGYSGSSTAEFGWNSSRASITPHQSWSAMLTGVQFWPMTWWARIDLTRMVLVTPSRASARMLRVSC